MEVVRSASRSLPRRHLLAAIPPSRGDDEPALRGLDEHTLLAESASGFQIQAQVRPPRRATALDRGPAWVALRPPPLLADGWQRIPGATVAIALQQDGLVHAPRVRFDRPLRELAFFRWVNCSERKRLHLDVSR